MRNHFRESEMDVACSEGDKGFMAAALVYMLELPNAGCPVAVSL